MGKRSVSGAALAAMVAGIITATAGTATAGPATDESRFVSKINHERSARGLRTLSVRSDLVSVARRHSARMAASGGIYHNRKLASEVSGNWTELGENVGVGPDVDTLHQAFMDSSGHRANILHRTFNQIGVGVVYDNDGLLYVTEVFANRAGVTRVVTHRAPTTTRRTATAPAARVATATASKPRPVPVEPAPDPRTVDLLERMIGLDADLSDPTGGAS